MKPLLAILAHESAQPSVDDFLPKWNALSCGKVFFVPEGHKLNVDGGTCEIGKSAHAGRLVIERFLLTLEWLYDLDQEKYIVIEYDTVPLRDELPDHRPGFVSSCLISAYPHNESSGKIQLCSLSPWMFDRESLAEFVEAGWKQFDKDPDGDEFCGLLDRWIGNVFVQHDIPAMNANNCFGYPCHPGSHEKIRRMNYAWVHGWKRKEDFGHLWK